jgi:dolichol kinase
VGELRRRLIHLSGSLLPGSYLLAVVDWPTLRRITLVLAIGAAALEAVRLTVGIDWRLFRSLTREYERENVAAYALFGFSTAIVAWLFSPAVAVPGMLMLSIADPLSGVLGRRVGGGWTASPEGVEPTAEEPIAGADAERDGDGTSDRGEAPTSEDAPDSAAGSPPAVDDSRGGRLDAGTGDDRDRKQGQPVVAGRGKPPVVLGVTFLVCFAIAWPFTVGIGGLVVGGAAAALGALGATLADGVKPVVAGYVLDDNLTIPPAACIGIQLVFLVGG